jgi:hypothetical protein
MPKKPNLRVQIADEPKRRPYAAAVRFILRSDRDLKFEREVSLLVSNVEIIKLRDVPSKDSTEIHERTFEARVEGFTTASEAERAGLKLVLALLWTAVSRCIPMRLDYHTPLPCTVFDRTLPVPVRFTSEVTVQQRYGLSGIVPVMQQVWDVPEIDHQLLLSMELFASARLEVSDRARFVTLVSSLEPLAQTAEYPEAVISLVKRLTTEVTNADLESIPEEERESIRRSLLGRVHQLQFESIRHALLKTVRELLPGDTEALAVIDEAYGLRSEILHEGATDPYLDTKAAVVEDVIRLMYAAKLNKPLDSPVTRKIQGRP